MQPPSPVLLAEDEDNDLYLMQRAFETAEISHPLVRVHDGAEGIRYLSGEGPYADRARHPLPALVITDIKMPKVDGFELLAWLRQQRQFHDLPAIAVSSSCLEEDLAKALEVGANAYYIKPSGLKDTADFARLLKRVWLNGEKMG